MTFSAKPSQIKLGSIVAPHLPMTRYWTDTLFAMEDVIVGEPTSIGETEVNVRNWVMKLLSRYSYLLGE